MSPFSRVSSVLLMVASFISVNVNGSALGVDVSEAWSIEDWNCLHHNYSIDFMVTRAWRESYGGEFDNTSIINIQNAQQVGIKYTDIYLFPCRSTDAVEQMTQLIGNMSEYNLWYGMIWLDIEQENDGSCNWSDYNQQENCKYIHQLADTGIKLGQNIGIYSGHHGWGAVFNSNYSACPSVNIYPLWFAHWDNKTDFNDYSNLKIGGWNLPSFKQYLGTSTVCKASIDNDWTEWY